MESDEASQYNTTQVNTIQDNVIQYKTRLEDETLEITRRQYTSIQTKTRQYNPI